MVLEIDRVMHKFDGDVHCYQLQHLKIFMSLFMY